MKSPKMKKRRMMFWRKSPKHRKMTAPSEPSILTPKQLEAGSPGSTQSIAFGKDSAKGNYKDKGSFHSANSCTM